MAKKKDVQRTRQARPAAVAGKKPLVFISHDSRDADLAEGFADLLRDVSGGVLKSFHSSEKGDSGIEFGTQWFKHVMTQLDAATQVVALLTPRSVDRPWILYEAGVAAGKLGVDVLGVAFGDVWGRVLASPFAQFQNSRDDEKDLLKLVMQLLRTIPEASPNEATVLSFVREFKSRADGALKSTKGSAKAEAKPVGESTTAKLFEEVKVMMQDLPERIADVLRPVLRKVRIGQVHFPHGDPKAQEFHDGKHQGSRKIYVAVKFESLFTKKPEVTVSLQRIDLGDTNEARIHRLDVRPENVRLDGFDLCFETWHESLIFDAVATWIAVGE